MESYAPISYMEGRSGSPGHPTSRDTWNLEGINGSQPSANSFIAPTSRREGEPVMRQEGIVPRTETLWNAAYYPIRLPEEGMSEDYPPISPLLLARWGLRQRREDQ